VQKKASQKATRTLKTSFNVSPEAKKTNARHASEVALLVVISLIAAFTVLPVATGKADTTSDANAIIQLTTNNITHGRTVPGITFQVSQIALNGNYAITLWSWGNGGGEEVFKSTSPGQWILIAGGGGYVNSKVLTGLGVPSDVAATLVGGIVNCPTQLRHPLSQARLRPHPMASAPATGVIACLMGASAPNPTPNPSHTPPCGHCGCNAACPQATGKKPPIH